MKKIMVRAWEIARKGQQEFGGKVSEYLSESLKIAWAEANETDIVEKLMKVTANHDTRTMEMELVENGRTVKVIENISQEDSMQLMADYASGMGYSTIDYYMIKDGAKHYRGRKEATSRSAA